MTSCQLFFLGKKNLKAIFIRIYVLGDLVGFSWLLSYWCCSLYFAYIDIKPTCLVVLLNSNEQDNVIKILFTQTIQSLSQKSCFIKVSNLNSLISLEGKDHLGNVTDWVWSPFTENSWKSRMLCLFSPVMEMSVLNNISQNWKRSRTVFQRFHVQMPRRDTLYVNRKILRRRYVQLVGMDLKGDLSEYLYLYTKGFGGTFRAGFMGHETSDSWDLLRLIFRCMMDSFLENQQGPR